jgi:hypothetical protein
VFDSEDFDMPKAISTKMKQFRPDGQFLLLSKMMGAKKTLKLTSFLTF